MATIKLKAPSGGSVSLVAEDTASDVVFTIPATPGSIVTTAALAAPTGSSLVGHDRTLNYAVGTLGWVINSGVVNVKMFPWLAKGDGVTDDSAAILAAALYAISTGKAVYAPSSTYRVNYNVLLLDFALSTSKTFVLFGDGATTIFKMLDGVMAGSGRRMLDFRPAVNMDVIEVRNLMLDNNARASTTPPSPYDYEQSHTLRHAAAAGVTTKMLRYSNVIIKDPVADGMNNQALGLDTWEILDCVEIDRTRVRSSIQQSYIPRRLVISNFVGASIESEPVSATLVASEVHISNSVVNTLDMAGYGSQNTLVTYRVSNTKVLVSMPVAGCNIQLNNCDVTLSGDARFNYLNAGSLITATKLRLPYNATTGFVTELYMFPQTGTTYHGVKFSDCDFFINYDGTLPVSASGFLVGGIAAVTAADLPFHTYQLDNCRFDPRAAGSVNANRNGEWILNNNEYACSALTTGVAAVLHVAGSATYRSKVTINGGDFRKCVGYGIGVSNTVAADAGGSLTLAGTMLGDAALNITKIASGAVTANDLFTYNTRVVGVAALPAYGINGDTVMLHTANVAYGMPASYIATVTSATVPAYKMLTQKGIVKGATGSRPAPAATDIGLRYLDSTLAAGGKPITWTGTAWVDGLGAVV